MSKKKVAKKHFGELDPLCHFSMNPYPDMSFMKCIVCNNKTAQRKLPLLIHVDPGNLIALNCTNRYCENCDTLIGHKHEIEHHLTELFLQINPEVIGNDYLVIGTVEKKAWQENIKQARPLEEMRQSIHDLKDYEELRVTMEGWFSNDVTPPTKTPPPSTKWVDDFNSSNDEDDAVYESKPDEQDLRIEKILGKSNANVSYANLITYLEFLEKKLTFPIEVVGMDDFQNQKFTLLKIENKLEDDSYGLMAKVIPFKASSRRNHFVPLCDLEVIDKKSSNHQLLDDYSVWYVNNM
jgi:hypothetical protein